MTGLRVRLVTFGTRACKSTKRTNHHPLSRNSIVLDNYSLPIQILVSSFTSNTQDKSKNFSKLFPDAKTALEGTIFPGAKLNIGGFGLGGIPETLIHELTQPSLQPHAQNLTIAGLTAGVDGFGVGKLLEAHDGKVVKRIIASYVGENKHFEELFLSGKLEVELVPQGTIAARMQAAGAGIPAFYTPAGAGMFFIL